MRPVKKKRTVFEMSSNTLVIYIHIYFFVLRKKGSKTKERMTEGEIEKGDCGLPTRKVFFFEVVGLEPSGT